MYVLFMVFFTDIVRSNVPSTNPENSADIQVWQVTGFDNLKELMMLSRQKHALYYHFCNFSKINYLVFW